MMRSAVAYAACVVLVACGQGGSSPNDHAAGNGADAGSGGDGGSAPANDSGPGQPSAGDAAPSSGVDGGGTNGSDSPYVPAGYHKTFDDEFDGTALDTTKWVPNWGWGVVLSGGYPNDEAVPQNVTVSNGLAHFVVSKGPTPGGRKYATGVASTYGKFTQAFGYFEARFRMGPGHGMWPAFWMLPPNNVQGEIDIMEWLGVEPTVDFMTYHYGNDQQAGGQYKGPDFSQGFHVFGLLWTSTAITWYVDGVERAKATAGIVTAPFFLILNNSTGNGWDNNWIDSTTVFPSSFDVDYVRVYAKD